MSYHQLISLLNKFGQHARPSVLQQLQREDGQDSIGIERHRLMGRYAKEDMTNGNATDVEADGIEGIMISRRLLRAPAHFF